MAEHGLAATLAVRIGIADRGTLTAVQTRTITTSRQRHVVFGVSLAFIAKAARIVFGTQAQVLPGEVLVDLTVIADSAVEITVRTIRVGTANLGPTGVVENGILFRTQVVTYFTEPCAAVQIRGASHAGIVGACAVYTALALCKGVAVGIRSTETYATQTKAKVLFA